MMSILECDNNEHNGVHRADNIAS